MLGGRDVLVIQPYTEWKMENLVLSQLEILGLCTGYSALELQAFEIGSTCLAFSTALRRAHKRLKSFTLYTNPAAAPPDPSFS